MPDTIISNDMYRDLYLEMLKKAEKETDMALVAMLRKRLDALRPEPVRTASGTLLYPFPKCDKGDNMVLSPTLFWKSGQFWQDLVQFMAVLATLMAWIIFFCYLLSAV